LFGYVNRYQSGTWALYDLQGRNVATYPFFAGQSEYRYDIAHLPNGIYIWRATFDRKIGQTGKIVKME
jgi:hypothetical protein